MFNQLFAPILLSFFPALSGKNWLSSSAGGGLPAMLIGLIPVGNESTHWIYKKKKRAELYQGIKLH